MAVTSVAEAIARATSMIGQGIRYRMGRGGVNPAAPTPADKNGECDCSGFVCWCLKMSRIVKHPAYPGGWINTTSMVADINKPVGFFSKITTPVPGAIWVYPETSTAGHVAIIDAVKKSGPTIIHCRSVSGDAVGRTAAGVFTKNPKSVLGWFAGYDNAAAVAPNELFDELFAP